MAAERMMQTFHPVRRALRMTWHVRRTAGLDRTYRRASGTPPERHTTTEIQRPSPTLFDVASDDPVRYESASAAYRARISEIVDQIMFEMEAPGPADEPTFEDIFEYDELTIGDESDPLMYRVIGEDVPS